MIKLKSCPLCKSGETNVVFFGRLEEGEVLNNAKAEISHRCDPELQPSIIMRHDNYSHLAEAWNKMAVKGSTKVIITPPLS